MTISKPSILSQIRSQRAQEKQDIQPKAASLTDAEIEAEIAKAVREVSEEAPVTERTPPALSPRHQRKLGLPVAKRSAVPTGSNGGLLAKLRAAGLSRGGK